MARARRRSPDFPANDVVYDQPTGDLYVSNDSGARKLYAATHGRSAWALTLP